MELFDYYKRKGKMKLLIGTGIFILALCAVYEDWGQFIFFVIAASIFFGIGFWQLRKGKLMQKNMIKVMQHFGMLILWLY
ncbi:hypothetical protein B0R37_26175 [Bacillus anthracis]|nr:hypothetical protein B0R37_26175 [Bacillus anthracis]